MRQSIPTVHIRVGAYRVGDARTAGGQKRDRMNNDGGIR